MKKLLATLAPVFVPALVWLVAPSPARAGTITATVTVNTSSFVGSLNPFEVFITLTDGSGTGDANNTVKLSGFSFGTGGAAGAVDTVNSANATGNLGTGVGMTDSTFSSSFAAFFTPGSSLSFTLADTFTGLDSPTPDLLAFALIESGAPLTTTDPTGSGNLVTVTFDSTAGTTAIYTDTNGADSVATPKVTSGAPVSTPELPSGLLLVAGLGLLGILARRRLGAGMRVS